MSRRSFIAGRTGSLLVVTLVLAACDSPSPTASTETPVKAGIATEASAAINVRNSSYEIVTYGFDVVPGNTGVLEALCPAGKRALGGGFQIGGGVMIDGPDVAVYESSPRVTSGDSGWRLVAVNRTADTRRFDVWVTCAAI
jgi:hypothetical protein